MSINNITAKLSNLSINQEEHQNTSNRYTKNSTCNCDYFEEVIDDILDSDLQVEKILDKIDTVNYNNLLGHLVANVRMLAKNGTRKDGQRLKDAILHLLHKPTVDPNTESHNNKTGGSNPILGNLVQAAIIGGSSGMKNAIDECLNELLTLNPEVNHTANCKNIWMMTLCQMGLSDTTQKEFDNYKDILKTLLAAGARPLIPLKKHTLTATPFESAFHANATRIMDLFVDHFYNTESENPFHESLKNDELHNAAMLLVETVRNLSSSDEEAPLETCRDLLGKMRRLMITENLRFYKTDIAFLEAAQRHLDRISKKNNNNA